MAKRLCRWLDLDTWKFMRLLILTITFMAQMMIAPAQLIIGHRGASHDAPENTLAAFKLAWEQGADGIEGDFRLTKDNEIVCIHDDTTKRTANKNLTVAKSTLQELRQLDVGTWKDAKFSGERLATLNEVFDIVPSGKRLFVEIKSSVDIMPALIQSMKKTTLSTEQVSFISFDEEVIAACRQQLPDYQAHWITGFKQNKLTRKWKPSIETVFSTLGKCHASGFDTQAEPKRITEDVVSRLRKAGLAFHCWTINDLELALRFQKLGVDSITTDRPGWLRAQLKL